MSVTHTSWPESRASFFSSGEASGSASSTSREMRPSSVSMPVATTTPIPVPLVMLVPLNSIEVRSETRAVGVDGGDRLVDACRLARQGGFVGVEVRCLGKPHIGGNHIARVEQDDVARHQALGGNQARAPVPAYPRRTGPERLQCLDGPHGLDFGDEPDHGIEREHADDRAALLPFTEVECEPSSDGEQPDHKALKLMDQDGESRRLFAARDGIRSVELQPPARLFFGKSGGRPRPAARRAHRRRAAHEGQSGTTSDFCGLLI